MTIARLFTLLTLLAVLTACGTCRESLTGYDTVTMAGDATKQALEKTPVGGLIYFSKNLVDRDQTAAMLANTKTYGKIPVFLGVDEEGGTVSRIGSNAAMGPKRSASVTTPSWSDGGCCSARAFPSPMTDVRCCASSRP